MADLTRGKSSCGVPIEERALGLRESHDEPRQDELTPSQFETLMAHLQGVEERYQAAIAALERRLDELSDRATKVPSTPPGTVDIQRGPQGLRVRGPAGYSLAIAVVLLAAVALWKLLPK